MPFSDPWPQWFVVPSGLHAFYGGNEGLYLTARQNVRSGFPGEMRILDASVTGPIDGPLWVTPQEDVVFYVSPGPGQAPGPYHRDKGRRLWLLRF